MAVSLRTSCDMTVFRQVAVGDFDDVDAVVETVREYMEPCKSHDRGESVNVPRWAHT
jgi:hypothetical protein